MTDESISSGALNTATESAETVDQTQQVEQPTESGQVEQSTESTESTDNQQTAEQEAPDEYEIQLPEDAKLPGNYLEDTTALAKEFGLTQEQAAALVERDAKLVAGYEQQTMEAYRAEVAGWAEQVKADPEIGGDNFTATQEAARAAVARFGDDALRQWLNDTGFGNSPMAVKFFANVGKALADDRPNLGGKPPQTNSDPASILYPTSEG